MKPIIGCQLCNLVELSHARGLPSRQPMNTDGYNRQSYLIRTIGDKFWDGCWGWAVRVLFSHRLENSAARGQQSNQSSFTGRTLQYNIIYIYIYIYNIAAEIVLLYTLSHCLSGPPSTNAWKGTGSPAAHWWICRVIMQLHGNSIGMQCVWSPGKRARLCHLVICRWIRRFTWVVTVSMSGIPQANNVSCTWLLSWLHVPCDRHKHADKRLRRNVDNFDRWLT